MNALVQRAGDQTQHRDQRAGGITDRRGDGKLNIPQANIAQRHRADVQKRHRQICPDYLPCHNRAADKDLIRRMQAHDRAHGDDHLEMCIPVLAAAADF